MRIVIILFLIGIVGSLGSALYHMVSERRADGRMARSLAIRVGLSVTLFLLLMASHYFGLIPDRS